VLAIDFIHNPTIVHSIAIKECVTPVQGLVFFKKTTLVHLIENHPLLKKKDDDSKSLLELAILSGLLG